MSTDYLFSSPSRPLILYVLVAAASSQKNDSWLQREKMRKEEALAKNPLRKVIPLSLVKRLVADVALLRRMAVSAEKRKLLVDLNISCKDFRDLPNCYLEYVNLPPFGLKAEIQRRNVCGIRKRHTQKWPKWDQLIGRQQSELFIKGW